MSSSSRHLRKDFSRQFHKMWLNSFNLKNWSNWYVVHIFWISRNLNRWHIIKMDTLRILRLWNGCGTLFIITWLIIKKNYFWNLQLLVTGLLLTVLGTCLSLWLGMDLILKDYHVHRHVSLFSSFQSTPQKISSSRNYYQLLKTQKALALFEECDITLIIKFNID